MKDQASSMVEQMNEQKEQVRKTVESAYENASREMKKMKRAAEDLVDDSRQVVRKGPLTSVGMAVVVGAALGFAAGLLTGLKSRR